MSYRVCEQQWCTWYAEYANPDDGYGDLNTEDKLQILLRGHDISNHAMEALIDNNTIERVILTVLILYLIMNYNDVYEYLRQGLVT